MNQTDLELTSTLFGFVFRRRSTLFGDVRNLRYTPGFSQGRRSRESEIRFEDTKGTAKLGAGLDDAEALAVIDKMLLIYSFSKRDKALDYIDLNG